MTEFYRDWASHFDVSMADWKSDQEFDLPYLKAVLHHGAGDSDIFGMRLQWKYLDHLLNRLGVLFPDVESDNEKLDAAFGNPTYLHLTRSDKVAQAVSLSRAKQSGLWHVNADGTERERLEDGVTPVYEFDLLSKLVVELEADDSAWLSWFSRQNIQPISINYEALSAIPWNVLDKILSTLDLAPFDVEAIFPKTKKLSNEENLEWVERFRVEKIEKSG